MKIFIMSERFLSTRVMNSGKSGIADTLQRDYCYATFQSMLRALDVNVIETKYRDPGKSVREDECYRGVLFTRDPVIVLPELKTIIYTTQRMVHEIESIMKSVPDDLGYQFIEIPNANIEGGNIFYSHQKKLFLHGINIDDRYTSDAKSNESLSKTLGIDVISIEPIAKILERGLFKYYYHLDCFMHLLPDGRLIILNKEMLVPDCRQELEKIFGNDFIDLEYEYDICPVNMNFVPVESTSGLTVVAGDFTPNLKEKFKSLGINILTRASVDARHADYNKELADKVATQLRDIGFSTATVDNLCTHLPSNQYGYLLEDQRFEDSTLHSKARNIFGEKYDDADYAKYPGYYPFVIGRGGPHCMTLDLEVDKVKLTPSLALIHMLFPPAKHNPVEQLSQKNAP